MNKNQAVCTCLSAYVGSPPNCRPECVVSTECPLTRACVNQKCMDPCPNSCGVNANCRIINHSPICFCNSGFTGDPFTACFRAPGMSCTSILNSVKIFIGVLYFHCQRCLETSLEPSPPVQRDPCLASPCGPNAICQNVGQTPACTCSPEYRGSPPNCRPECTINSECPSNQACIREKCRDPCPGSCGLNAQCSVFNHVPVCSCIEGYTGDPFSRCDQKIPSSK